MITRFNSKFFIFASIATLLASFSASTVQAAPRFIVVPGRIAILIMEGVSSGGQDPDPQRLYDSIAMTPDHQSGGDGKAMVTGEKAMSLTCAMKTVPVNNVICTITVKPSSKSKIDFKSMGYHTDGADALMLNTKLAGVSGVFTFQTGNRSLKIESTPEHFDLSYQP